MKKFIIIFKASENENIDSLLKRKIIRIPIDEGESGGVELNFHKGNLSKKWIKKIVGSSE
jgi:hypothetical protein